ncbi:putative membrane protein YbfM [Lysinibacillus alkalisoli]|uniref:Membrane protein YbfM n=1 Tax=Lysinibacillus alkalisoli TaxID=1911548 RepID=A0A917G9E0_9BACI|nr:DedA family protein [Lysinibacillus alkalisoli]GGG30420.1 putative membrane protein YbfM [Lysinibacillus alkalisoli]
MTVDFIIHAFSTYGYIIIFICAFFGIIGIPAPEESLLVIIGMACVTGSMDFTHAVFFAVIGTIVGMMTGYLLGKKLGLPMLQRWGHYVGFTEERWQHVSQRYVRKSRLTIIGAYFLPGIRQISPYVAGVAKLRLSLFMTYSIIGAIVWIVPYMAAGYFIGRYFNIPPVYISSIGFILFGLFIVHLIIQYIKKKWKGAKKA